jgi:hypothetical protein
MVARRLARMLTNHNQHVLFPQIQCWNCVAVYAVNSKIMYSVVVFCCSCCALHEAVAGSVYMTYL